MPIMSRYCVPVMALALLFCANLHAATPGEDPEAFEQQDDGLAAALQLDEKQRKAYADANALMQVAADDATRFNEELNDYILSDEYSEQGVKDRFDRFNKDNQKKRADADKAMRAFRDSLSPAQKKKLESMQKKSLQNLRVKHGKGEPPESKRP